MRSNVFGVVHVGAAAAATLISLWAADLPLAHKVFTAGIGLWVGRRAGSITGGTLERRVDRGGGIVLYTEDTAFSALVWPLGAIVLSPFALGTMVLGIVRSPAIRWGLQVMLCGMTAAWLAHDLAVERALHRLRDTVGPLQVQWFHGRSAVGPEAMIGRRGIVTAPCAPDGHIRTGGELWRARSIDGSPLSAGQAVTVRRLNGLVLLVESADSSAVGAEPSPDRVAGDH